MKRLWVVAFLALMFIVPLGYSSLTIVDEPLHVSDDAQPVLDRIYGELIVDEIYEQVMNSQFQDIVQKVTENGSRYILGSIEARDEGPNLYLRQYLLQEFEELSNGRLEIEIIGDYYNIVAKLPGYLPGTHPAFVVSAHYDSPDGSPGANCDGSGLAAVLILIEIMSQYEWPLDIYFMVFNGLHPVAPILFMEGSKEVATELRSRGFETLAFYNIDTILVPHPSVPSDSRIQMGYDLFEDYTSSQYWAELTRMISNNYGGNNIRTVPSETFLLWTLSDHYAFAQRGFSGVVCAFESGYNIDEAYHQPTDTWDNPTYVYYLGKEVTAAIGSSMAFTMSRTYGEPTRLDYSLIVRTENSERLYIPITTPTQIEVSCRWYGGPATFRLYDPNSQIVDAAVFDSASAWEYTDVFVSSVSTQGLYTIDIENTGPRSVGFELNYTYNSDIDDNGIIDSQEFWIDNALFSTDGDSDGLSTAEELFLGTDDTSADSDGDTMDDKFEVDNGFDPRDPSDANEDADGDGLTNAQEYSGGLNPLSADTDSDNMPDLWELENGLDPLVDDSMLDPDEDGKTNLQEYLEDSDPHSLELEPIPTIWFVAPPVVVALIGGFLYWRRHSFG